MRVKDAVRKELNIGDLATVRGYDNELIIFCVAYIGVEGFLGFCLSHRIVGMMEKYFRYSEECPYSFRITSRNETDEHKEILESLKK